ncbi:hypothetical protein [Turneriella parva]|uniref:DUF4340 domain-containing protein n=1 Tax=Turneriella parva (strain ATCC BAA-1111 / DSM 21527 / NCTC 11395 / H) TaxID=869212 RepID=I4B597_TURPD|nr:hypothetical protein [Turneriella parva]AFM12454.1 hypothetical protein Turpa_1807 [Turneriella parva DSM 21527]
MNFILRNRIALLFAGSFVILLLALFWPEAKKSGELQKYYTRPADQLVAISYQGEMQLGDKQKVSVAYDILKEENVLKPKEPVYRIEVRELNTTDKSLMARVADLSKLKRFYASSLVKTIVLDWAAPDYYFLLPYESAITEAKETEYGFKNCPNQLKLQFKADTKEFCIGAASQGDTRRYLLDRQKNQIVIGPDYTVRRLLNNIFAQREQSLHPYGNEGIDTVDLKVSPVLLEKYPLLREKTGGTLKLRMLVKDEGNRKINVWHVEKLLSIKPSHAAEYAQLLQAMRINALLAIDAPAPNAALADIAKSVGLGIKVLPAIEGSVSVKQTDKQDTLVSRYAFFAPDTKPPGGMALQQDKTLVRPRDTFVLSSFNAGYITADLYPRMLAILQKIENDLREAQKAGEEQKAKKEKKAKESPQPSVPAR